MEHVARTVAPNLTAVGKTCREHLLKATEEVWQQALDLGIEPSEIGIVLSGGVDTSAILSALGELGHRPAAAVTVFATKEATDVPYAQGLAAQARIPHIALYSTPDEIMSQALEFTISTLGTYDGMELRNSVVVAYALQVAKRFGLKYLITGDASDELLGGYSFSWKTEEPLWSQKRAEMCAEWTFSGPSLAKALGLHAVSPYCTDTYKAWALSLSKEECIGNRLIELYPGMERQDHITGKVPLREAYPEAFSAWRRKDPIEVGSGSTILGKTHFDSHFPDFEVMKTRIETNENVKIRDKEHLHYYLIFKQVFPKLLSKNEQGLESARDIKENEVSPLPARFVTTENANACVDCGFNLYNETCLFCRVCGAWPARIIKKEE